MLREEPFFLSFPTRSAANLSLSVSALWTLDGPALLVLVCVFPFPSFDEEESKDLKAEEEEEEASAFSAAEAELLFGVILLVVEVEGLLLLRWSLTCRV